MRRAASSEVELAVLGTAHERVPLGGREDQCRAVRVLGVADHDGLVDEGHFDAVVGVGAAARALEPLCRAQIEPETLRFAFHNGSSTSISIISMDSSGGRAVDRIVSKSGMYLPSSS